ncbi:MAG TPA: FAD-dependent oxidoreductase [Dehalococcoidia bacterium]|nr:FAD-dependent oxidoreductase [Dehalococcoidia bacterium]
MAGAPAFPNYMQMPRRVPLRVWLVVRYLAVLLCLALCVLLVTRPRDGLTIFWGVAIPLLPITFFVAPGLWRNSCPLAAMNQAPRLLRITRGLTPPDWLRRYAFAIAMVQFLVLVSLRKVWFNSNGTALALLILYAMIAPFIGGLIFKGKSGWCSSICPLLPPQRVYGQTPIVLLPNAHCQPCVGCTKNCYDFNPRVAHLADMGDADAHWSGLRKLFFGLFPGMVLAFYRVPTPPAISDAQMYGRFLLYMGVSAGLFFALEALLRVSAVKLTTLFAAAALGIYYYYNVPALFGRLHDATGLTAGDAVIWTVRGAVFALAAWWVVRTYLQERAFAAQAAPAPAAAGPVRIGAGAIGALERSSRGGEPEVRFVPEDRSFVAERGRTILDAAEACGLRIEAGCRMGMCGADPVSIVAGMENLSDVTGDERATLERLGLAENTRMACCARVQGAVTVSLKPERPQTLSSSVIAGFNFDRSIEKVVVIGNGIAGITAADHIRRRHPLCAIDVIARERHLLYNRMGIERLIYGRSAMQGLFLLDEGWYEQYQITCWLNTRAAHIDTQQRIVALSTGETLPYDRLVLATGSSSTIPPIDGFGLPGSYVLREADDAMAVRGFAQDYDCRRAVVAGGGLLGLEAAYALRKLGLRVSVLERSAGLLRRQLDPRGSGFLREYLEGLGLEILTEAETAEVAGNGRVNEVRLKDGRSVSCDLFVVAAGITPNTQLAAEAGLAVNRGIVVNARMQTSVPEIYAAGDVAEFEGQINGLWPTAVAQAEVAAVNAAGGDKVFTDTASVTMLKVAGIDLSSIGRTTREHPGELAIVDVIEEGGVHRYRRVVIAENRIVGAILLGFPQDAPHVTAAVRQRVDVSSCMPALRAGEWDALAALVKA